MYFRCDRLKATMTISSCLAGRDKAKSSSTCYKCSVAETYHRDNIVNTNKILAEAEVGLLKPPPVGRFVRIHSSERKQMAKNYNKTRMGRKWLRT